MSAPNSGERARNPAASTPAVPAPAVPIPSAAPLPGAVSKAEVAKAMKVLPPVSPAKTSLDYIPAVGMVPGQDVPKVRSVDPRTLTDMRSCDPKLYENFYQNLLVQICKTSRMSYCPWASKDILATVIRGGAVLGAAAMVGGGGKYVERFWEVANYKEALKEHMEDIRESISHLKIDPAIWEKEGLKELVESDAKAADKGSLTLLLSVVKREHPEADTKFLIKNALKGFPTSAFSKAFVTKALYYGLLGTVATKASGIVGFMADNTATACDEAGDENMTTDADNHCAVKFDLSSQVLNFLSLSPERRQQALTNPNVCSYYTKFNEILKDHSFEIPPQNIRCNSDGGASYDVTLQKDKDSPPLNYHIDVMNDTDGDSRTMHASLKSNITASQAFVTDFNIDFYQEDGMPSFRAARYHGVDRLGHVSPQEENTNWNGLSADRYFYNSTYASQNYYPIFRQALIMHKVFEPIVKYCCAVKDNVQRGKCIATLEKPKGLTLSDVEKEVETPPQTVAPASK